MAGNMCQDAGDEGTILNIMYSNKDNVNILTSQLVGYGVRHAVVCPGSRNAPIVHNLNTHPQIACHAVTDERSAAFYAIGLCLATDSPVVVCVTSGSALMNVAPAVVEAMYQHLPLIVVSADRAPQWIGQQDGQTMPQHGALQQFVRHSVSLPEPSNDEQRWYCRRLVNECLVACRKGCGAPVHINVPISEPLFDFTVSTLSEAHVVRFVEPGVQAGNIGEMMRELLSAERPMLVVGQANNEHLCEEYIRLLSQKMVVVREPLSTSYVERCPIDMAVSAISGQKDYQPDFLLYVGDAIVSKNLKHFLRRCDGCREWIVNADGAFYDTFTHLSGIVQAHPADILRHIAQAADTFDAAVRRQSFLRMWQELLQKCCDKIDSHVPSYSQLMAVKHFEQLIDTLDMPHSVHYANSMVVRLGSLFARHHIFCNRGVNGIEGSLSAACGYSLASDGRAFCVTGDLSFFYDSNALWQQELKDNLRVLLINNGRGAIFGNLKGLELSPAREKLVSASHEADAQGVCRQNNITYLTAADAAELDCRLRQLVFGESDRPMLLEVFTDADVDSTEFRQIMAV